MSEHKAREAREAREFRETEDKRDRAAFIATLAAVLESGDRGGGEYRHINGLLASREYVARARELLSEAETAEGL